MTGIFTASDGSTDPVHEGVFEWEKQPIYWKEEVGGKVLFCRNAKGPYAGIDSFLEELADSDENRDAAKLAIINTILAIFRPQSIGDDNHYHAASVGLVRHKNSDYADLYVAMNNDKAIEHDFVRGCAEKALIRRVIEDTHDEDFTFAEIYLMSGRMEKNWEKKLKDIERHTACPCGECRRMLREHADEHTQFYMVPTNPGDLPLEVNRTAETLKQLDEGQVWGLDFKTIYRLPIYHYLKAEYISDVMAGYELITDKVQEVPALTTWLHDLPIEEDGSQIITAANKLRFAKAIAPTMTYEPLNENPTLVNINRTLLTLIKEAYRGHDGAPGEAQLKIKAVVVKLNNGKLYRSVQVNGRLLSSQSEAVPAALANALNMKDVAEVYTMTFDKEQMQYETAEIQKNNQVIHQMNMPDPAELGRIIKNMPSVGHATLRMLPINDGTLSEERLLALSHPPIDVRDAFRPPFSSPKNEIEEGIEQKRGLTR